MPEFFQIQDGHLDLSGDLSGMGKKGTHIRDKRAAGWWPNVSHTPLWSSSRSCRRIAGRRLRRWPDENAIGGAELAGCVLAIWTGHLQPPYGSHGIARYTSARSHLSGAGTQFYKQKK